MMTLLGSEMISYDISGYISFQVNGYGLMFYYQTVKRFCTNLDRRQKRHQNQNKTHINELGRTGRRVLINRNIKISPTVNSLLHFYMYSVNLNCRSILVFQVFLPFTSSEDRALLIHDWGCISPRLLYCGLCYLQL